jgi:uncharacterized alpha-E superfamily protein
LLARIGYELFWIGRYCARAEHTARVLDGVFRVNLQGVPDDPAGVTLSWESLLAMAGAKPANGDGGRASGGTVIRQLTLDPSSPASVVACITRARSGCSTVRDVISAEMWEALNTLHLELRNTDLAAALQAGPHSVYALIKERCALFWGLAEQTMLRDQARAFLDAGRQLEAADMVLRMLRVALPPEGGEEEGERAAVHDGQAFALLHAVGGFQAFRRASAAPPHVFPVATFLLFQREYPHSIAASVAALLDSLRAADHRSHDSPPVLRLRRLAADLEFRRGSVDATGLGALVTHVQGELELSDRDIATRYFAGADMRPHVLTA